MRRIRLFIERFGWVGFLRLLIYPITALITTPVRLAQSLWSSRTLANGDWRGVVGFAARPAMVTLFYLTLADNMHTFGRRGRTPFAGLGNYPISNWFPYMTPSLFAYWRLTPLVPLIGMFGWIGFHVLWTSQVPTTWALVVIAFALISTSFYANLFVYQNYNVLGWMFFPAGLYALINGHLVMAAVVWLACSFASATVLIIAGAISVAVAISERSLWPLMTMIPATIKLALPLVAADRSSTAASVLKAIGFKRRGARYKFSRIATAVPFGRGFEGIYFGLLYIQFLVATILLAPSMSLIVAAAVLIGIVNAMVARFADGQSIIMMMMSVATVVMMRNQNPVLLPSYWLLMSPIPLLMYLSHRDRPVDVVPRYEPFSGRHLVSEMGRFFAPVRERQRVLMAFDNPGQDYEKIFDGYRVLIELPSHVATTRRFHFMPDWWAVFELNYEGAPDFWGRDPQSVIKNAEQWQADYVIVYQTGGGDLAPQWAAAGFELAGSRFSWAEYGDELRGERLYLADAPEWWLLRPPRRNAV